jgi:NDP-sugar pyrophosphorylase family protein
LLNQQRDNVTERSTLPQKTVTIASPKNCPREGPPEPKELDELDFAKHVFPKALSSFANTETPALWAQQMEGFWSDIGNPAQYLQISSGH